MIKKLRWRFILIAMASSFVVLLLITVSVNCVNIYQNLQSADEITEMLLQNDGYFQTEQTEFDDSEPPEIPEGGFDSPDGEVPSDTPEKRENKDNGRQNILHNMDELPFSTRYFTITLDESGTVTDMDLSSIASVSEDEVSAIAAKILSRSRSVGWYESYRYRVGDTDDGTLIIVMEATSVRGSIFSVLMITLVVSVAALLVVFLLVFFFSKKAIQPISATYEKQKQFITDASHELKTPLTVISANAEILSLTYGENEWCDGITRQSERMRQLIAQMIQMSKLDEEKQHMVMEKFNLSDAVYDTAMSFTGPASKRELQLSVETEPDLSFVGDEAAIRQVVAILVDNAVKYCDQKGSVTVNLTKQKNKGKESLLLQITNSYHDIGALETDRLFDRFYRGDKAHSSSNSYGLGLPIAKSMVEQHNGKIAVKNINDEAVEFSVTLPWKE